MLARNGTVASPATALEVIDAHERTPLDAYLDSTAKTRSRIIEELSELRDTEQQLADELTRQAGEARTRCSNYARAIEALGTRGAKTKAKAKPDKPAPKSEDWQVSEAKVVEVEAALRAALPTSPVSGGVTVQHVFNNSGMGRETIRKAINVLREREVLRIAGSTKGGGVLYALMPESTNGN